MNLNLTLFAQAITFALFIWFSAKFIWPPLMRAIDTRQEQIAQGLAAGEQGKKELEYAAQRKEELLLEARQTAHEIVAQADKRGLEIVEEAKNAAKIEGDRMIAGAKAEINQEILRAKESLRTQVGILAVAGAEKILRREVDAKAHAEMLREVEAQL